jgi:hypothetical protein
VSSILVAGGLRLPLEPTPAGPLLSTSADAALEPLAWVVNAAVTGDLPELRECVQRGEDAVIQGLSAVRPQPGDDVDEAAARWRGLTDAEPGDDAYLVGTSFGTGSLLVPRRALLEVLDALERVRAAPGGGEVDAEELDELERRAAELDRRAAPPPRSPDEAGAVSAARRFLLMALDQAGVTDAEREVDPGHRPLLRAYRNAARARAEYGRSAERAQLVRDAGPPRVSLDWFRRPSPRPNPLEAPFHWLATCEGTLLAADLGDAGAGEVFLRHRDGWWSLAWRADDGVTPVLVGARAVRAR